MVEFSTSSKNISHIAISSIILQDVSDPVLLMPNNESMPSASMIIMISCTASMSCIMHPFFNNILDAKWHFHTVVECTSFETGIYTITIYSYHCLLHFV